MPWTHPVSVTQSWTTVTKSQQTWQASGAPSTETRLNRVFALPETTAGNVDYVWHIASDGFFLVATGNQVQIKSRITDGP